MYQALYRKWRPKAFADVVGQSHITDTLRRQAAHNRLSHAYLFTGTRGTGKTTCAKILAKAVNCQSPVDGDPCNVCPACTGIDNGSLLDVLELDAASNNGVDHVRALRDEAIYSPASVRYRVYIVDEVHMLSVAAFNALLKILEEPPAHLIFILATTELHKVPATILSRCQRFAFKRIRPQDIAARLQYVAQEEKILLDPDAANLLARLSDGALRDGLSLLDQCAAAGGEINTARVLDVLGLAGNVQTAELMGYLLRRDVQSALLMLDKLYRGGKDVSTLLNELSVLTRDLLIRLTAPKGGMELLSGGYDGKLMDQLSQNIPPQRLIFMAAQLQSTSAALPLSSNRRTDAELCLMRLCDEGLCGDPAALSARIARLEDAARSAPPVPPPPPLVPSPPPVPRVQTPAPAEDDVPPWYGDVPPPPDDGPPPYGELVPPVLPKPETVREEPPESPPPQPETPESGDGLWDSLLERYKERLTPMYWYMLDDASGVLEDNTMVIHCGDELTLENLDCPAVSDVIRAVTGQRLGKEIAVRFILGNTAHEDEDKLNDLIRRGSKFDSFTIKP